MNEIKLINLVLDFILIFHITHSVSYITANIYFKSRNLPNTDVRNYSIDLQYFLRHPETTAQLW